MPLERRSTYTPETSWDNSGNYNGVYDQLVADVDAEIGIEVVRGRDQARGRGLGRLASSSHTLRNDHRRYSAENAGSPLNGQLLPGRPHRLSATYGGAVLLDDPEVYLNDRDALLDGVGDVYLFTGTIDDLAQLSSLSERRVAVNCLGSLSKLQGHRISTSLYQSVTTGAAVEAALQAAGLTTAEYDIDQDMIDNGRTMTYWYADDEELITVLNQLIFDTEGYPAAMYERGDGVIAIEGRNYRTLTTRSQEVQATFIDTSAAGDAEIDDVGVFLDDSRVFLDGGSQGLFHIGFRYVPGIRDVINSAVQEVVTRTEQSSGVVWTYGQTVTLDSDGAATVIAKPSDPFKSAIVPSVGGGDFSLSAGSVTVALSRTSGGSTVISFSGGTSGATVSNLRLRANALTETSTTRVENQLDMSDSIAAFDYRTVQLAGWPGLSVNQALALCDGVVIAYGEPRPLIEIDVVNGSGRLLSQIMTREVSDRIRVIDFQTGADLQVTIEQIKHSIRTGRIHTTTFSCEKVVEADWARYDVDLYGTGLYGQ